MLKRMVNGVLSWFGCRIVRTNWLAELERDAAARGELERTLAQSATARAELQRAVDEYKRKYEHLPTDMLGYRNALQLALRDLAYHRAAVETLRGAAPGRLAA